MSQPLKKAAAPTPVITDGPEEAYVSKVDRRTALAWVGVVGAALAAGAGVVVYGERPKGSAKPRGYGTDPNLVKPAKAPWPRIMTAAQLQAAALVSDVILPASGTAPSASGLGVPDFLNEWVSAPYPDQLKDRAIILDGLEGMRMRARREHGKDFAELAAAERSALVLTLAQAGAASPERAFFRKLRSLVVGAYYTTPEGFRDIGYIGNVPRTRDEGPSDDVKAHLERELAKLGL
ncbi:MAG: gluconate 2-dehydrogenase subunit 3 family protein [Phenylobacterium sp.]